MATATLDRLRRRQPEATDRLAAAEGAAWRSGDPALLELCRRRLAQTLDSTSSTYDRVEPLDSDLERWWASPRFSAAVKAHLAFSEQFSMSVSSVSEEDVAGLLRFSGPHEVYDCVGALHVIDLMERWERVTRAVL